MHAKLTQFAQKLLGEAMKKTSPQQKKRPVYGRSWLWGACMLALCSCDGAKKVTAQVHAFKQANSAAAPETAHRPEGTTLYVSVVPATGISLLIDGVRVGDTSPYIASNLQPGPHVLHVRAMGFYSVTLPIKLGANQQLRVPVALRPRHGVKGPEVAGQQTQAAAAEPRDQGGLVLGQQPATAPATTPLPAGARALLLSVVLEPAAAVVVDGEPSVSSEVRLIHGAGMLALGDVQLPYVISAGHVLDLTVPHDDAAWFRDGSQVKATSQLRLEASPMQLRRVASTGQMQQATLRRLE